MALDDIRISLTWRRHPKRIKLQRRLGAEGVLALEDLWAHVADTKSLRADGHLRNMTAEDIAIAAGWDGDPLEFVEALAADDLRLLDRVGDEWQIHDWVEHQDHAAGYDEYVEEMRRRGGKGGRASAQKRAKASGQPTAPADAQAGDRANGQASGSAPAQPPTYLPTQPTQPTVPTVQADDPPLELLVEPPLDELPAVDEVVNGWNTHVGAAGLDRVEFLTNDRRNRVEVTVSSIQLTRRLMTVLWSRICESDWLCGRVEGKTWRADFDWVFERPKRVAQILEGRHINRDPPETTKPKSAVDKLLDYGSEP